MKTHKKKILFYNQHLIGIGHHVRNSQLIDALAKNYRIFVLDGGRSVQGWESTESIERIQLKPIFLDGGNLQAPPELEQNIEEVMRDRKQKISDTIERIEPDCLVVEHFPFGRWQLYDEIHFVLKTAESVRQDVKTVCSLRDIPLRAGDPLMMNKYMTGALINVDRIRFYSVPRGGKGYQDEQKKYSKSTSLYYNMVFPIINESFDLLLVHADPNLTKLDDHFPWMEDLSIPIQYTGYVAETLAKKSGSRPGKNQGLEATEGYVLVSAGGGAESFDLAEACIQAWQDLMDQDLIDGLKMHIFTGPFIADNDFKRLKEICVSDSIQVNKFTLNFLEMMAHARLSISRAGYNTCMNLLETRTPAILVPSEPMGDQVFRARRLSELGLAEMIHQTRLTPHQVMKSILRGLSQPRTKHNIDLNGAKKTLDLIQKLWEDQEYEDIHSPTY